MERLKDWRAKGSTRAKPAVVATAFLMLVAIAGACGSDEGEEAGASRCLPFPIAPGEAAFSAEDLITNSDTGQRNVPGDITKAAAVKSSERVSPDAPLPGQRGKPIYFVSINVGGRTVTLAHSDVEDTGTPTGSGLWVAVDAFSELATHFPYNPDAPIAKALKASLDTDGARGSRACVG